jgi:hypothetical protein
MKRRALSLAVIGAAAAMLTYTLLHDEGGWPKDAQDNFVQLCLNQGATKEQCRCSLGVAEDFFNTNSKLTEVQTNGLPAEYTDAIRRKCS